MKQGKTETRVNNIKPFTALYILHPFGLKSFNLVRASLKLKNPLKARDHISIELKYTLHQKPILYSILHRTFFSDRKSFLPGAGAPLSAMPNPIILLQLGDSTMPGFTESLVIIAIILAIIVLPKRFAKKQEPVQRRKKRSPKLTGWTRMAILLSMLWLSFLAFYLKPWNSDWLMFIYIGIGPVALYWGLFWTWLGFKKKKQ